MLEAHRNDSISVLLRVLRARIGYQVGHSEHLGLVRCVPTLSQKILSHLVIELLLTLRGRLSASLSVRSCDGLL